MTVGIGDFNFIPLHGSIGRWAAAAALYAAGRPRLAFLFGVFVLVSHGMDYMLAEK